MASPSRQPSPEAMEEEVEVVAEGEVEVIDLAQSHSSSESVVMIFHGRKTNGRAGTS